MVKNPPPSAGAAGDMGLIPGSGRSPGVGNVNPFQYSCLENSMDRGAWWATYSPWGCKESDMTEWLTHIHIQASWVVLVIKNPSEMQEIQEMQVWSLGQKNSLRRKWQPTPVFLSGKFLGQRILVGCSPWRSRVRHSWATELTHNSLCLSLSDTHTHTHTFRLLLCLLHWHW